MKRNIRDRHASGDITAHNPRATTPIPMGVAHRAKKQGLFRTPSTISMVLPHRSSLSPSKQPNKDLKPPTPKITEALPKPRQRSPPKHMVPKQMRKFINPPLIPLKREVSAKFGSSAARFGPVVY